MNPNGHERVDPDEDIRAILKNHHKKIYYVCRLFAHNYKQHRELFVSILSAASRSIQKRKSKKEKYVLFLRACINMAALHSIATSLSPDRENEPGAYKSPDYQKSMNNLRNALQGMTDYEKIHLFLHSENVIPEEIAEISGHSIPENKKRGPKHNRQFIPFIKEKLIWS